MKYMTENDEWIDYDDLNFIQVGQTEEMDENEKVYIDFTPFYAKKV